MRDRDRDDRLGFTNASSGDSRNGDSRNGDSRNNNDSNGTCSLLLPLCLLCLPLQRAGESAATNDEYAKFIAMLPKPPASEIDSRARNKAGE